jgi:hypothetical protein
MKAKNYAPPVVGVADEVWVATALLHRELPDREDFTIAEIVERARTEGLQPALRPGVYVHVVQHCVANRPRKPARHRMLYETRRGYRRLFRPDDDWHPDRNGGRTRPATDALPDRYRELLEWYDGWSGRNVDLVEDPILALRGLGQEIWADEPADEYVARLRRGWE